jgi:hypothetical protein
VLILATLLSGSTVASTTTACHADTIKTSLKGTMPVAGDATSGTWGTSPWNFNANTGVLNIQAGTLGNQKILHGLKME